MSKDWAPHMAGSCHLHTFWVFVLLVWLYINKLQPDWVRPLLQNSVRTKHVQSEQSCVVFLGSEFFLPRHSFGKGSATLFGEESCHEVLFAVLGIEHRTFTLSYIPCPSLPQPFLKFIFYFETESNSGAQGGLRLVNLLTQLPSRLELQASTTMPDSDLNCWHMIICTVVPLCL